MKHGKVTECSDPNLVRDSMQELQQEIVRMMNRRGWEEIQSQEKIEVEWIDIQGWQIELRRLISFFQ